jgi:hemoglobin
MDRLRAHQFAFLSQACDGPRQYQGKSMAKAHAHLAIEQKHFDAVAGHLIETLRSLEIGEELIGEVVGKVAPLASQIVNSPAVNA